MKKSIIQLFIILNCFSGCITDYTAPGIEEVADILVVEGVITDNETLIMLSRSLNLTEENTYSLLVDNAKVYVECDDETQWLAEAIGETTFKRYLYRIETGKLNPDKNYRLRIEIEEPDYDSEDCFTNLNTGGMSCPSKIYVYGSEFSKPILTPEVDSVFWYKRGLGQLVMLYVATQSQDNQIMYYRWSYKEDWEINAEFFLEGYPFRCWNMNSSRDLLIGSAERTVVGKVMDMLTSIVPNSPKLSILYRIDVKQNAISKRAYDYFINIKKNSQQIGNIFAPVPSELRGNIICLNDNDRPVIGYVDVSTTTQKRRYITRNDNVYEAPFSSLCESLTEDSLMVMYPMDPELELEWTPPFDWVLYDSIIRTPPDDYEYFYKPRRCVNCTYYGVPQMPDDWPKND